MSFNRKLFIVKTAVSGLVLALTATTLAQTTETLIAVSYQGKERATFVPRSMPYFEGGPSVGVYLVDRQDVRLQDGLVITGFAFIGWTEGDATRVQVFALVPTKDAPNTYLPSGKSELLQRRDFASYRVARGESVSVDGMRALGIEPMVLSSQVR